MQARASHKKLTAALEADGKELMKPESEQTEKERRQAEKVAQSAVKGGKGKAKAKEPAKRKANSPLGSSEFRLPLIGV